MSESHLSKRERILRVAERMFAAHGYIAVGMREIASSAEVSVALLTYHFGTKENLYREIFKARSDVLEARVKQLNDVDLQAPDAIEKIVAAFVEPQMQIRNTPDGLDFAHLLAREATDQSEVTRGIIAEYYDPLAMEFIAAIQAVRPGLDATTIRWKYLFAVGAISMSVVDDRARRLGADEDLTLEEKSSILQRFLVNAFRE